MTHSSHPVVVITGASAGIGRATAMAFVKRGYRVGLIARSADDLQEEVEQIRATGGQAEGAAADMASWDDVTRAAETFLALWGRIDVWVNNAMVSVFSPADRMDPEEFRRVTEVSYLGYVFGTLAALRHMKTRDAGTIVQVGSALSYRAIPLQSAYCAAKFAVRGFTDSLRTELLHDRSRVRLTMVQLPAVNTPQFDWARNKMGRAVRPLGKIFEPEPIAEKIVTAAEQRPRELWVGLSAITAIVSSFACPGLGDRLASRAYEGQLDKGAPAGEDDNLVRGSKRGHTAHGRFDRKAHHHVVAAPAAGVISALAISGIAVIGAIAVALSRR